MSRGARGVLCLVLAALAFPRVHAQENGASPLDDTTPVTWEFEGRGFPTPNGTEEALAAVEPAMAPEEEAWAKAIETEYGATPGEEEVPGTTLVSPAPPDMVDLLWKALGSLCLVVGVILMGFFLLRKFAGRTPLLMGQQLGRVIGKVSLGPRATLHYVRTGGRILVIGTTQNSITPIAEFEEETFTEFLGEEPGSPAAPASRQDFLDALNEAAGKRGGESPAMAEDDDLDQLRTDLQRLRRHLQDGGRDRES